MSKGAERVAERRIKYIDQELEVGQAILKLIELSSLGQVALELDQLTDNTVRIRASWIEKVKEAKGDI